jgi:hypothetical protein
VGLERAGGARLIVYGCHKKSTDHLLRTGWYLNNPPNNFTDAKSSALTTGFRSISPRVKKGGVRSPRHHLRGQIFGASTCGTGAFSRHSRQSKKERPRDRASHLRGEFFGASTMAPAGSM